MAFDGSDSSYDGMETVKRWEAAEEVEEEVERVEVERGDGPEVREVEREDGLESWGGGDGGAAIASGNKDGPDDTSAT